MDEITEAVLDLYQQHPFPNSQKLVESITPIHALDELFLGLGSRKIIEGARVLEIGCGTGEVMLKCAQTFPQVEFIGLDLAIKSLDIAAELAKSQQIENVTFVQGDVLEEAMIPEGPFDAVLSHGSMHHLADPLKGVINVVKHLKPGGICAMSLYNKHGRRDWERLMKGVKLLQGSYDQDGIAMAKTLTPFFADGPRSFLSSPLLNKDSFVTDSFFHPQVHEFDVKSLYPFLEKADLVLRRIVFDTDPLGRSNFPARFPQKVRQKLQQLSSRERYEFMELVQRPPLFHFFAQRTPISEPPTIENIDQCRPLLASFMALKRVQNRRGGAHILSSPLGDTEIKPTEWKLLDACNGKESCLEIVKSLFEAKNLPEAMSCFDRWAKEGWLYLLPPGV